MDVVITIACYILHIDCLMIALDAHMFSHTGYGPGNRAPGPRPGPISIMAEHILGDRSFWALGPGPGPISIRAEHMCVKGNQQAFNRQYIAGNLAYHMSCL